MQDGASFICFYILLPILHLIEKFNYAGKIVEVLAEELLQALSDKSISSDNKHEQKRNVLPFDDVKLLLMRFADRQLFRKDTSGGDSTLRVEKVSHIDDQRTRCFVLWFCND